MGFYPSKPRSNRGQPIKNKISEREAHESETGRLVGVIPFTKWKALKKKTIKEMVLKAALSRSQLQIYYDQEKVNKAELRKHCMKNLDFDTPEAVQVVARYGKMIF